MHLEVTEVDPRVESVSRRELAAPDMASPTRLQAPALRGCDAGTQRPRHAIASAQRHPDASRSGSMSDVTGHSTLALSPTNVNLNEG